MSRRALRPRADTCHLCEFVASRQALSRHQIRTPKYISPLRSSFPSSRRAYSQKTQHAQVSEILAKRKTTQIQESPRKLTGGGHVSKLDLEQTYGEIKKTIDALLSLERIPTEREVTQVLQQCSTLANDLVLEQTPTSSDKKTRAATALLSLDDSGSRPSKLSQTNPYLQLELSNLVYCVLVHPPVFLTPNILNLYVRVQATLKRPETFPEAFNLYANKPLPEEGSSPIRYADQNPNKVANAIPKPVADLALQTAIEAKQLVVAMDIVESSYATSAFRRAKFVRKGLLPATGVAVAPFAAYTLASQLAVLQTTMETGMATNVAFAGMLAYVGFTATIGVVAVTTANDQMDRVTWTPGLPLRERWIREEERAAIDKIAGAWGFREIWRRGEEEGEEWDALREWIGMKGMILDRTELMEGME